MEHISATLADAEFPTVGALRAFFADTVESIAAAVVAEPGPSEAVVEFVSVFKVSVEESYRWERRLRGVVLASIKYPI